MEDRIGTVRLPSSSGRAELELDIFSQPGTSWWTGQLRYERREYLEGPSEPVPTQRVSRRMMLSRAVVGTLVQCLRRWADGGETFQLGLPPWRDEEVHVSLGPDNRFDAGPGKAVFALNIDGGPMSVELCLVVDPSCVDELADGLERLATIETWRWQLPLLGNRPWLSV